MGIISIWITGDIHGNPVRFSTENFFEQKKFSGNKEDNTVIILGDFGLIWDRDGKNAREKYWLDWLEDKPFTTVFVDGNHENHIRLATYPVKEWNGGLINEIRPHVLHLKRGEVFTIEENKFFAFGGASSHDVSDGILDYEDEGWREQAKELDHQGKYMYRIKGLTWWKDELPVKEEMDNGIRNLEKHDWKVDYIITHSPPASVIASIGYGLYEQDILTRYLEQIRAKLDFKVHFMGHMHINKILNNKDALLYEQITRIV